MDAYALAMIDAARSTLGMERVARRARYLESAARLGLGTNDPESIDLVAGNGELESCPSSTVENENFWLCDELAERSAGVAPWTNGWGKAGGG